jgi:hypothetical protein
VKLRGFAALAVLLAALVVVVAGCGGGTTTKVIERTVTVESGGKEVGGGEAQSAEEEREAVAKVEDEDAEESALIEAEELEAAAEEKAAAAKEKAEAAKEKGQPEENVEEPTRVLHLQTFRTPSGNIGCAMYEGGARCDIRKRDWKPLPRPASCSKEVDYGQGLAISHGGEATFVCAGDTALDPGGSALSYGTASEVGGTECISRSDGVTCVNQAGHGFFISVQSYQVF